MPIHLFQAAHTLKPVEIYMLGVQILYMLLVERVTVIGVEHNWEDLRNVLVILAIKMEDYNVLMSSSLKVLIRQVVKTFK